MRWLKQIGAKGLASTRAKALLLLVLFAVVLAFANSANLHKLIHPNATSPDHFCLVTLLTSGQVDAACSVAIVESTPGILVSFILPEAPVVAESFLNLPPGRGPPAVLS
jgi:hypothetical protein